MRFVDIVPLEGASKGEGLGNKSLSHIRQVEMPLLKFIRFEDPNITMQVLSIQSATSKSSNTELYLSP